MQDGLVAFLWEVNMKEGPGFQKGLYLEIRYHQIDWGEGEADVLASKIAKFIKQQCYIGTRWLEADHPAHHAFNRLLFYVSTPEYIDHIRECHGKDRDVQEKQ